jgi:hypothetical protein
MRSTKDPLPSSIQMEESSGRSQRAAMTSRSSPWPSTGRALLVAVSPRLNRTISRYPVNLHAAAKLLAHRRMSGSDFFCLNYWAELI